MCVHVSTVYKPYTHTHTHKQYIAPTIIILISCPWHQCIRTSGLLYIAIYIYMCTASGATVAAGSGAGGLCTCTTCSLQAHKLMLNKNRDVLSCRSTCTCMHKL